MELNVTIPPEGITPIGKEQQEAGVGILLQISMLVLSFVLGHLLRRHKFYYLPEASASLLIGLVVGGFANVSNTEMNIRAANVFCCAYLVNLARPTNHRIPMKHQKALWYSGLRGAMAFALALQSVHDLPEGHGKTIFTATTAIVVLTVGFL